MTSRKAGGEAQEGVVSPPGDDSVEPDPIFATCSAPKEDQPQEAEQEHKYDQQEDNYDQHEDKYDEQEEKYDEQENLFLKCRSKSREDIELDRIERRLSEESVAENDHFSNDDKRRSFKVQDGTRLRPPLAVTAGTSADSGTGDSGSAEIQTDILFASQSERFDGRMPISESRTFNGAGNNNKSGKQSVKPFTKNSRDRLENRTVQLVRDYGFQPKRRTSVEDGAVLPNKFEPFPGNLYGRPLEEIDNFIYDEVSMKLIIKKKYYFVCSIK